ncbi:MAG: hypothetical protein B7Z37_31045 [Verrucomicrobia bacterium 12-59-8]|nr:MAG: hypothetical protein B7Z37_31045 [Verrucomicrobia bacterium 12-59-8]
MKAAINALSARRPEQDALAALWQAGQSAQAQILYPQAMEYYRAAAVFNSKQGDVLQWLALQNAISWLYHLQGRYPLALAQTQQVWHAAQQSGKTEAPEVLAAHMLYAGALNDNGQAAVAEHECRKVIEMQRRVLGAEHPDTLNSRNNLADALRGQGKAAEAGREQCEVLKIRGRVQGAEHPDTLATRGNLALALLDQGKRAEAEQEHRAVLKIRERVLGAEHPSAALSCYNLALCLEAQQKLSEALSYTQRAERVFTKILGPDHPHTQSAKIWRERLDAKLK